MDRKERSLEFLKTFQAQGFDLNDLIILIEEFNPATSVVNHQDISETKIERFLLTLGVPSNLSGFDYIKSAVGLCIEDSSFLNGITTRLYPKLADKYGSTISAVERCIRHAISATFRKGNPELLREVCGTFCSNGVKNSVFISLLVRYLKAENI